MSKSLSKYGTITGARIELSEDFERAQTPHRKNGYGDLELVDRSTRASFTIWSSESRIDRLEQELTVGSAVVAMRKTYTVESIQRVARGEAKVAARPAIKMRQI